MYNELGTFPNIQVWFNNETFTTERVEDRYVIDYKNIKSPRGGSDFLHQMYRSRF